MMTWQECVPTRVVFASCILVSAAGTAQLGYLQALSSLLCSQMHAGDDWTSPAFYAGCASGCLCSAIVIRAMELRISLVLGSAAITFSSLVLPVCDAFDEWYLFIALRYLNGFSIGFFISLQTLFISDLTLFVHRNNLLILSGLMLSSGYFVGILIVHSHVFEFTNGCYYAMVLPAIPSFAFFILGLHLKESVRTQMMSGRRDEARQSAAYYHNADNVDVALSEAVDRLRAEKHLGSRSPGSPTLKAMAIATSVNIAAALSGHIPHIAIPLPSPPQTLAQVLSVMPSLTIQLFVALCACVLPQRFLVLSSIVGVIFVRLVIIVMENVFSENDATGLYALMVCLSALYGFVNGVGLVHKSWSIASELTFGQTTANVQAVVFGIRFIVSAVAALASTRMEINDTHSNGIWFLLMLFNLGLLWMLMPTVDGLTPLQILNQLGYEHRLRASQEQVEEVRSMLSDLWTVSEESEDQSGV